MTIITSVSQLLSMPLQGICQGGQPLMSFNFGAGKTDRVKQTFRLQFGFCVALAALFWVVSMLAPQVLAGVFTTDPELVSYTAWAMRIYMAGIFSCGFQAPASKALWHWDRLRSAVYGLPAQADPADPSDFYSAALYARQGFRCLSG